MSVPYRVNNIADAQQEANRLKQELDDTYTRYKAALIGVPINFQSDIHKYLCIRLAGYLEQLFYISVTGYVKSSNNTKISRFALNHFKHAPNMRPGNLEELISRFGDEWSENLRIFLDDNNRREMLGRLLEIRNVTAHGGNYRGTSLQVNSYKQLVDDIHNWVLRTVLVAGS